MTNTKLTFIYKGVITYIDLFLRSSFKVEE